MRSSDGMRPDNETLLKLLSELRLADVRLGDTIAFGDREWQLTPEGWVRVARIVIDTDEGFRNRHYELGAPAYGEGIREVF